VDDNAEVGRLLDQVAGPVASFTANGAYDQEDVAATVAERHPAAAVIVPPRATAVPSETAETEPTQRDRAEAAIGGFKQVIGGGPRSRTDRGRATEVDVAVHALNRMLELGRPISVRIA
jgi:hypothetical protein